MRRPGASRWDGLVLEGSRAARGGPACDAAVAGGSGGGHAGTRSARGSGSAYARRASRAGCARAGSARRSARGMAGTLWLHGVNLRCERVAASGASVVATGNGGADTVV